MLIGSSVLEHLKPLLGDPVTAIQYSAILGVGRLANNTEASADGIISHGILPLIVVHLQRDNKYHKKAAAFALRSVAKHSERQGHAVIASGAVAHLVACCNEFDSLVREPAAWALGTIARHSEPLASAVIEAGGIPALVSCYKEPDLTLKRTAIAALSDISKHSEVMARLVIDAEILPSMSKDIEHQDSGVKRQVTACLTQVAKHSVSCAETVIASEAIPRCVMAIKDLNEVVRKNACSILREVARHNENLAKQVVASGGIAALIEYMGDTNGINRLPAILTLGYIASSEVLALAIIGSGGVNPLREGLIEEPEDCVKASIAYSLGQIGQHSPEHAKALIEVDILRRLLAVHLHEESSEDLRKKAKKAIKLIVTQATVVGMLEVMLVDSPPAVLKIIVRQIAKVLHNDIPGRKMFVQSRSLERLQKIYADPGSKLAAAIAEVNSLYPPEIVSYYSPLYPESLLKKIDEMKV